jgi:hypothetical protein
MNNETRDRVVVRSAGTGRETTRRPKVPLGDEWRQSGDLAEEARE